MSDCKVCVDKAVIDVTSTDVNTKLIEVCKRLMDDDPWRSADPADIEVKAVTGGITNVLYRLGARPGASCPLVPVLARVFGKAGDSVCDRETENTVMLELARIGFGPKLHGIFGNGRLEGWLQERRPLEPLEMLQLEPVDIVAAIARKLAEMHERCNLTTSAEIWSQLQQWLDKARMVRFPDDTNRAAKLERLKPFPRFADEIGFIKEILPAPEDKLDADLLEGVSGIERQAKALLYEKRFCHMDLLSGNIMHSEELRDVVFIDFEYALSTHVGLDIATHFNAVPESCLILGGAFDVEKYYPNRAVQTRFLRAYLEGRNIQPAEDLIEAMLKVLMDFTLLAELRWCIWAVVQAGSSPVDFDYLEYSRMRFEDGYQKYKAWRLAGGRCQ